MNSLTHSKSSLNSNTRCADLMTLAERELSAFFHAITQLFGAEQAKRSAEDWLQELIEIDGLPTSVSEWRFMTAKVSARLANRMNVLPLSAEPQLA